MKRILILLLLLAVAGSLFAQLTWTGSVLGGFGLTKLEDAEEISVGTGTNALDAGNYRLRLNGVAANEAGTAGGRFRVQASGVPSGFTTALSIPYAWGWMNFADGLVKVLGGKVTELEFNSVDSWYANSYFSGAYGLQAYVYPSDLFRFGVGVKTTNSVTDGKNMDGMTGWLGLGADLDAISLAAQLEAGKDNANAFVSASYEGLSDLGLTLGVYAEFANLTEFSDAGEINTGLTVDYSGMLDAWLYVIPYFFMEEGSDMFLAFNCGAEYGVNDLVSAGLDVNYIFQGGTYDGLFDWDETLVKDHSFVGFKPYVTFSPNGTSSNIKLGYYLTKDLSKSDPEDIKKGSLNHAAFIDFSWSF